MEWGRHSIYSVDNGMIHGRKDMNIYDEWIIMKSLRQSIQSSATVPGRKIIDLINREICYRTRKGRQSIGESSDEFRLNVLEWVDDLLFVGSRWIDDNRREPILEEKQLEGRGEEGGLTKCTAEVYCCGSMAIPADSGYERPPLPCNYTTSNQPLLFLERRKQKNMFPSSFPTNYRCTVPFTW